MLITDNSSETFVLLDDCTSSLSAKSSRLYTNLHKILVCTNAAELNQLLDQVQRETEQGFYAVGCFTYELGAELMGITPRSQDRPYAEILIFAFCEYMTADEVTTWLHKKCRTVVVEGGPGEHAPSGIMNVQESVEENALYAALARIRDWLTSGDSYQVNFTYRLTLDAYGTPWALYQRLRQRQPVPYGALLVFPDGRAVLSLSPELFLRHESGHLTACPMKGTARTTLDDKENAERAVQLATHPKTVAENVMIVDLLRSDLGRIATFGTVKVPRLLDVQQYGQVLQMTSTVTASLRDNATLSDVFNAIYPCGSITGAPKRRTMQIIRNLEEDSRGLYTGAIGWFAPAAKQRRVGDFCLSVPIRTLELHPPGATGVRQGKMGIGAGIVYDSIAADEIDECRLKGRFVTALPHQFDLIETMHATAKEGIRYLGTHMARLRRSAATFGFPFNEVRVAQQLHDMCLGLSTGTFRLKLSLVADGQCHLREERLEPIGGPVSFIVAQHPIGNLGILAGHKTNWRTHYDAAIQTAQQHGAFDMLLFNSGNYLLEGARSNVFVRIDGCWYTPPLSLGILPGVMRTILLADPLWTATERLLTVSDLYKAEEIILCNALRGPMTAMLRDSWS